jgi:sec-independent protein translocase protein TatA
MAYMQNLAFITMPGTPEMIVIFLVVLVLFGPKSLPSLGRALGESIREFKNATNRITESVMAEADTPKAIEPRREPQQATEPRREPQPVVARDAEQTQEKV